MEIPTLIYCASGNSRMAQIAIAAGYKYGSQLPGTIYHQPYFADQNWKKPNRAVYMAALAKYRPYMASVLDWEKQEQLTEVLDWAIEAAQYVEVVMIIPKVHGGVKVLPRLIEGKRVRLGYSVPTKYGGTDLFIHEFSGWDVHLLGGSPQRQMDISRYLDVKSADGNYAAKMANHCQFFVNGTARYAHDRYWVSLVEADGKEWDTDARYEAFRRSCINIMQAWCDIKRIHDAQMQPNLFEAPHA